MAVGAYGAAGARNMTHPVLDMQRALNGGMVAEPRSTGFLDDFGDVIDNTPRVVAAFVLGAAIVLLLLKRAGFRFNFGVGGKVG